MRIRAVGAVSVLALLAGMGSASARADVDLELRPRRDVTALGNVVEVDLYAVSDEGTGFSAMDVILTWDSMTLELLEVVDTSPHNWDFIYGLLPDSQIDGLNDSLLDGDAYFQAVSFSTATATVNGVRVATLRFSTLAVSNQAEIAIESSRGKHTHTQVFLPSFGDVTGALGSAGLSVVLAPRLSAWDMFVPAGRTDAVVVYGQIDDEPTFGMAILLEIKPRAGYAGTVEFTEAPPVDIVQLGDPWPGVGLFSPADTDASFSPQLNGAVDENGTFIPAPLTFAGALVAFPVTAGVDAAGVWDVVLTAAGTDSSWEGLVTSRRSAVLTIVSLGDGNGDEAINFADFAQMQLCFGAELSQGALPDYGSEPGPPCGVYDFDGNGVIDIADYADLNAVLSGPAP